jgi:hypothetical protein
LKPRASEAAVMIVMGSAGKMRVFTVLMEESCNFWSRFNPVWMVNQVSVASNNESSFHQ